MKLDRNEKGRGKYAVVNLRKLETELTAWKAAGGNGEMTTRIVESTLDFLHKNGILGYGEPGTQDEFFVLKLKDRFAGAALEEYATVARRGGEPEYADDVKELADRAGAKSLWSKTPD